MSHADLSISFYLFRVFFLFFINFYLPNNAIGIITMIIISNMIIIITVIQLLTIYNAIVVSSNNAQVTGTRSSQVTDKPTHKIRNSWLYKCLFTTRRQDCRHRAAV